MKKLRWTLTLASVAATCLAVTPALGHAQGFTIVGGMGPGGQLSIPVHQDSPASTAPAPDTAAAKKAWLSTLEGVITKDTAPDGKLLVVVVDDKRLDKEGITKFVDGVRAGTVVVKESHEGSPEEAKKYDVKPTEHLTVITTQ